MSKSSASDDQPKILWFAFKLFDKSVDKATWLETIEGLSIKYNVRLLTLYRDRPELIIAGGNAVRYVRKIGSGWVSKVLTRLLSFFYLTWELVVWRPEAVIINGEVPLVLLKIVNFYQKKIKFITVFDVRTLPVGDRQQHFEKLLSESLNFVSKNFSGVTYITPTMREYCINKFNLPKHQSIIWTSGVNPDLFGLKTMPESLKFKICYHGGILSRARGIITLVESLTMLRDIPIELHLVSSLREPELISTIKNLGVSDTVYLHETMPYSDIPDFIGNCHAGIIPLPDFPGWNTSSPIKLFEYLSCGRPVIVTPITAHSNVIQNKPFAFFSKSDSASDLADAIRDAYAKVDSFEQLSKLARFEAINNHTWESQSKILGKFISNLIGGARRLR